MSMRNLGLLSLLFPSFPPVYFSDTFFFFKHDGVCCHIWVMQHWQKIEKTVGSSAAAYLTWTFLAIRENLITYVSHPTDPLTQLNSSVFFSVPSDSLLSSNCLRLMMAFYLRWLSCTWGKLWCAAKSIWKYQPEGSWEDLIWCCLQTVSKS